MSLPLDRFGSVNDMHPLLPAAAAPLRAAAGMSPAGIKD